MTIPSLKLIAFDVDGVFTDGRFLMDEDGRELKMFHTQDGYGIRALLEAGFHVAIITGRRSGAVCARMRELDVEHVIQGCRDKLRALEKLCESLSVSLAETAYVGDDIPDQAAIEAAGFGIAVANAVEVVRSAADFVTRSRGGDGAVREISDLILAQHTKP